MPGRLLRRLKSCTSLLEPAVLARHRFHSTSAIPSDALGPLHSNEDEHKTFRVRKDGKSKSLPLPPVLDPVIRSERSRWEQPKAQPCVENFTPFQKQLWENPYAHALASPIRQCRSTFVLLPVALLVTLHPRPHPETSDPWLLPVSLTTATTPSHLGTPFRFLGRKLVAQQLGKKSGWKGGLYSRFTEKLGPTKVSKMVWREDMSDLILSLLQKSLLDKLRWYFRQSGQLIPCASPWTGDIEHIDDASCVLHFGTLRTRADEIQEQALKSLVRVEREAKYWAARYTDETDPHIQPNATYKAPIWYRGPLVPQLNPRIRFPPLDFKTTEWRGARAAVYSLQDLLGEDRVKELVVGSRLEGEKCAVVKRARHNVPLGMMLMQLQAYMATTGP